QSRSGYRGSTAASASTRCAISDGPLFLRFHIFAQDSVDRGLIAAAMLAEERQHVGINAQGNLLLRSRPDYRSGEEIRTLLWNIGKVNVFVSKRINSLPVRLGLPF